MCAERVVLEPLNAGRRLNSACVSAFPDFERSLKVQLMWGQGKRYALPNTRIMLHHPSGSARGQASDIHNEARELMRLRNYVNQVLSLQTGQPVEKARPSVPTLGFQVLGALTRLRIYVKAGPLSAVRAADGSCAPSY